MDVLTEVMWSTQVLLVVQHEGPAPEIAVRRTMTDHVEGRPKLSQTQRFWDVLEELDPWPACTYRQVPKFKKDVEDARMVNWPPYEVGCCDLILNRITGRRKVARPAWTQFSCYSSVSLEVVVKKGEDVFCATRGSSLILRRSGKARVRNHVRHRSELQTTRSRMLFTRRDVQRAECIAS
jgi:hypothetical protein